MSLCESSNELADFPLSKIKTLAEEKMPITVRNEFEVTSTNVAVGRLKQLVERRMHIPTALQSLFFNGMELQDDGTLVQFGVDLNSTLFLIVRGDGNQENPPLLNEDDEQG